MENDNNNNKKDNLNKENRNFKNQNNYYSNKDNKPHFYNTKYSGNSRRQNYNNNNHYNHNYNNYNHYYNKRQFEQKPNFINSSGKTFDNVKRGNYNDNKYDISRIKTYSGEGGNNKNETKLKFIGKFKNPNSDDIKAPKRNYNEYNINNKYYDKKLKMEEEKENEPGKIVFRNSKKQINDESNENLKDLDTKGDLFLEKFNKISEQSNVINTERKEPKRKFYNYFQKGTSNSIDEDDYYIKDENENLKNYRKNNYQKKKNYYNNEYDNYNEYNNDNEIINEITNPNQYEKKFEKVEEKKEMKIIKKKNEDKPEKKVEDLHEKVTFNFENQAKSLKDLLG